KSRLRRQFNPRLLTLPFFRHQERGALPGPLPEHASSSSFNLKLRSPLFHCPQFGAADPRVGAYFLLAGSEYVASQNACLTPSLPALKCLFHPAVFERMETENYQSTGRSEDRETSAKKSLQVLRFAVDRQAQRLEGSRRWMNLVEAR